MPIQVFASDSKSTFSQAELDQMLAPIALYPDSLLSQILMASTYPANVAEAVKWSKSNPKQEGDAAVKAVQDKSWDPRVMSLVAFPQVLEMMGKEPDWVQDLGDAFLAESETVMDSVQDLRRKAKDEGNLKTTKEQKVIIEQPTTEQKVVVEQQTTQEIIIIEPADPAVVYVPVYNPTVVYGTWWWPSYRPYYYSPPGYGFGSAIVAGIGFGIGVGITNSLWGGCNWGRGRGSVDINVNRYNNININSNNRLDASRKTSNWNHNGNNRRAPYRDKASQGKYNKKLGGADKRQDFRGRDGNKNTRDAERQRAQETLKKRGNDPAAARNKLSGAEGDKVRSQVSKIDRDQASNKFNSRDNKSRDRGSKLSSSELGNKSKTRNNSQTRDRAKSSNISLNRSKNSTETTPRTAAPIIIL